MKTATVPSAPRARESQPAREPVHRTLLEPPLFFDVFQLRELKHQAAEAHDIEAREVTTSQLADFIQSLVDEHLRDGALWQREHNNGVRQ